MTLTEYSDNLMNELEHREFDKIVNFYQPPIDVLSAFLINLSAIGLTFNLPISEMADIFISEFNKTVTELFPPTNKTIN